MQAKQDYSTAVLYMVSLSQESTVQRLFRIECNTTFGENEHTNKKKKSLLYILGYLEETETHFLSSPDAPKTVSVH